MKLSDKKAMWGLSIISVLLLMNTFLKQYSESKIADYKSEITTLQNNLNAELGRVMYYTLKANQDESLSLLLTINKSIEVDSIISPIANPTNDIIIDSIEQRKSELKRQLKEKEITASDYYNERLKIDCSSFEEHFNNYNKLNGNLLSKIKNGTIWSPWNRFFTVVEFMLILINVVGHSYILVTNYNKNKTVVRQLRGKSLILL